MSFFSLLFGRDVRVVGGGGTAAQASQGGVRKTASCAYAGGDDLQPKVILFNTPVELVPVRDSQHKRKPQPWMPHRESVPVSHDSLSLWSRLLCRPEVYDPHVEAAPLTHLLDLSRAHAVVEDDNKDDVPPAQEQERPFSGPITKGRSAAAALSHDEGEHGGEVEYAMTSSTMRNASSDVEELGEEEQQSNGEQSDTGESLLHPQAFHVFDTRRCRSRTSTFFSSLWSAETEHRCIAPLHGGGSVRPANTTIRASRSSNDSVASTERRLISQEELTRKRLQMRQQTREAARRAREHKEAWAALVASAALDTGGTRKCKAAEQTHERCAEEHHHLPSPVTSTSRTPLPKTSLLTNEALESLRHGTQPLLPHDVPQPFPARLGYDTQLPMTVRAGGTRGEEASLAVEHEAKESCCSRSSSGSSRLVLNDELVNVQTGLAVMYRTVVRCRDPALQMRHVNGQTALPRTHRAATTTTTAATAGRVQCTRAGKYPLGSRAYVERVMFAQRRQQECALFALLTEAHRQARGAYLHLAQLYYYYVIPILAHYTVEEESRGLERSLLQCGSGSLRVFHSDFCRTVVHHGCVPEMSGYGGASVSPAYCFQVQPVDYQMAEYRFEKAWRELFLEVKSYLGMQTCESASCSTLLVSSPHRDDAEADTDTTSCQSGSVCVAATVLHSMELFERQRHIHSAAQDATEWLCWYHYYVLPRVQSATSAEERTATLRTLLPAAPPQSPMAACQSSEEEEEEDVYDDAAGHTGDSVLRQPHPLEREYLPLSWTLACSPEQREKVLCYRRGLKLRAIRNSRTPQSVTSNHSAAHGAIDHTRMVNVAQSTSSVSVNTDEAPRKTVDANAVATSCGGYLLERGVGSGDLLKGVHEMRAGELTVKKMEEGVGELDLLGRSPPLLSDGAIRWQKDGALNSDDRDSVEIEEEEEEDASALGTYPVVNVGCFGLSFFSIFD
ncbi:hypothetical protein JKF63_03834 [Porcisia hertigi]|uniref:Uncharacterized protein n=1 Tax=Porcisia hertigi TaxID=2761500 RepID=A0A836L7E5_9TRYP|nr:hypothetical protein JKF63_03834 [Porcisia hertigi]